MIIDGHTHILSLAADPAFTVEYGREGSLCIYRSMGMLPSSRMPTEAEWEASGFTSAGWPVIGPMESLRDQWLLAPDMPTQKALASDIQLQAFTDVPCLPLGLYYQPAAYRNDLTDMMKGLILFTGIRRV